MIGNSNDETNFLHKILLNDTQVSKIRKAFAYVSSAKIKFSKGQLSKIIQLGGCAHNFLIKKIVNKADESSKEKCHLLIY